MLFKETAADLSKEEQEWQKEKKLIIRREKLEEDKKLTKHKKITTSKLLVLFLFLNCSLIEIFTGWATIVMLNNASITGLIDFTPLVTLIGSVVGEVLGYAIYALKSAKENSIGGITYDMAMKDITNDDAVG